MADFDPSVISSIPSRVGDPTESYEKALNIKDMLDRNQLQDLQVGEAKRSANESEQARQILQRSDYSTPQGVASTAAKLNRVSPSAAMDLMKFGQQYQSGQVQQQIDQLQLLDQRQGMIVSAIDPIVSQARQMKQSGASDLDIKAYITQQMPGALQQLRSLQLPDGKPALPDDQLQMVSQVPGGYSLPTLETWESRSKAGQAAIKQRLDQFKADTAAKAETVRERQADTQQAGELEREKHDRASEWLSRYKIDNSQFTPDQQGMLAALADKNVNLPAGMRSQAQIRATLDGLRARHPDESADQIADDIVSGKLKLTAETRGAQTAGNQIGKVALAANELDTFGDQVMTASRNLPRNLPVGLTLRGLMQMGEKQASNTGLLTLRLKLQALNNAYDQLASRGGTDAEKRGHIASLFDARLTDQAIQALVLGVKQEAEGARQAANRTVGEVSGTAIPGAAIPGAGGTPGNVPAGAGASAAQTPPVAAGAPAPTPAAAMPAGGAALQPGQTYRHASGATVEILPDGQ
jgi:hypothetical protein